MGSLDIQEKYAKDKIEDLCDKYGSNNIRVLVGKLKTLIELVGIEGTDEVLGDLIENANNQ